MAMEDPHRDPAEVLAGERERIMSRTDRSEALAEAWRLREQNPPLHYDDLIVDGGYRERVPEMILRNLLNMGALDMERELDPESADPLADLELRTVPEEYISMADVLAWDLNHACETASWAPTPAEEEDIASILSLVADLLRYGAMHLSMTSEFWPARYASRCARVRDRCAKTWGELGRGGDHPNVAAQMRRLDDVCDAVRADRRLDDLQKRRNEAYRERNAVNIKWALDSINDLNARIESCDPMDQTQRRLLTDLVNRAYDWLKDLESDH